MDSWTRRRACLGLAAMAAASVAQAGIVLIDDFALGQAPITRATFGHTATYRPISGVFTDRTLGLGFTNGGSTPPGMNSARIQGGLATYAADPDVSGSMTLDYAGGLRDLSESQWFRVSFQQLTAPLEVNLYVFSDNLSGFGAVVFGSRIVAINSTEALFDRWDFDSGIDWGRIDRVQVVVVAPAGGGFSISRFEAVPEPATIFGLAIGATLWRCRVSRKALGFRAQT